MTESDRDRRVREGNPPRRRSITVAGGRKLRDVIPIEKRPKCARCGKPLRPETSQTNWDYATADERAEIEPENAIAEIVTSAGRKAWTYWTGKYQGYGVFCTLTCAWSFAELAYKAGYRVKAK